MTEIGGITTQPVTRSLSDGNEYIFDPIGPAAWSAFCVWANNRAGERATRIMPLDEMLEAAASVDGMIWLCWRSASGNHKLPPVQKFSELLSMKDLQELTPAIMDLPDDDDDGSAEGNESPSTG